MKVVVVLYLVLLFLLFLGKYDLVGI